MTEYRILIDADACPVVKITEQIAREGEVPVTILCDTNHILHSDYSDIKVIGAGKDAVDFALVTMCKRGDIVVTQDYGVAAMALGKGAYCIHQSGRGYTDENIDQMLMERHIHQKERRGSHKNHSKVPKKRTGADDVHYADSLRRLLRKVEGGDTCI